MRIIVTGGNSGVGIRSPLKGDPAYVGMEIQLIDDVNWGKLQPWQHTGSIYDVQQTAKIQGEVRTTSETGWKTRKRVNGTVFRSLAEVPPAGAGAGAKP